MNAAIRKYFHVISKDDLHRCRLIGLWNALARFDEDCGMKFTSYLYLVVQTQCKKHIISEINQTKRARIFGTLGAYVSKNIISDTEYRPEEWGIKEDLEQLPDHMRKLIHQRFYKNMTFAEIGRANKYSHEAARQKVNKAIDKLKSLWA